MGNNWIVDLGHFLNATGALALKLLRRARTLAEFWAEIVSQATLFDEPTTIRCRRRPRHRACATVLYVTFDDTMDAALWECPQCHDGGAIRGWQGTFWDHSELTEPPS